MTSPRVGVVTQARTTSTRLPGKVLREASGRTMLDHHLDRLEAAGLDVYVATTVNATDDPLVELAGRRGVPVFRGSEQHVLSRFHGCAVENGLDVVVRVTSDCPLVDGALVRHGVDLWLERDDPDVYVSNGLVRTYPRGLDFEVFSFAALDEAMRLATDPADLEHVTPYLHQDRNGRMHLVDVTSPVDRSAYRITLDTEDDLRLITTLIEQHDALGLDAEGLGALLDAHPELVAVNAHVEQKKLGS
ncbi:cytidylyltransferase domain-containing protein [Solicola sp. PLA-1-18]|uniref:cytidylyltransferase domain-containing protein n=1 Tax=Solicola sp. PLA-1-18 TaxID=3380532 RepID=UPI003B78A766